MNHENAHQFIEFAKKVADEVSFWVDWHNAVFGMNGKFMELFSTCDDRLEFTKSSYNDIINDIAEELRKGKSIKEWTRETKNGCW